MDSVPVVMITKSDVDWIHITGNLPEQRWSIGELERLQEGRSRSTISVQFEVAVKPVDKLRLHGEAVQWKTGM